MQSIELIRNNLIRSEEIVLSRIEDMRGHGLIFPTPNGGCHTLWVLGHLTYIEVLVTQEFMLGLSNPLIAWKELFDGDEIVADANHYPLFDDVLAKCREMRASTIKLIDTLTEDDLDKLSVNAPKGFEDLFGTYRHCLQFVADHWYMHRGQLADTRRSAGLERMWF